MAKFEDIYNELVKSSETSTVYSKSAVVNLTNALINDTDFSYDELKVSGDSFETETKTPSKDLRASLKKITKKEFGIDDTELSKLDTATLPSDFAKSVTELSSYAVKKYIDSGKTYQFPLTSKDEAVMKIKTEKVGETTKATTKPVETSPGHYESVPTGKTIKTLQHNKIVAKNAVPGWLKEDVTK